VLQQHLLSEKYIFELRETSDWSLLRSVVLSVPRDHGGFCCGLFASPAMLSVAGIVRRNIERRRIAEVTQAEDSIRLNPFPGSVVR
jgi:hypothetical protein